MQSHHIYYTLLLLHLFVKQGQPCKKKCDRDEAKALEGSADKWKPPPDWGMKTSDWVNLEDQMASPCPKDTWPTYIDKLPKRSVRPAKQLVSGAICTHECPKAFFTPAANPNFIDQPPRPGQQVVQKRLQNSVEEQNAKAIPWVARIETQSRRRYKNFVTECGASIISTRWLITAAECVVLAEFQTSTMIFTGSMSSNVADWFANQRTGQFEYQYQGFYKSERHVTHPTYTTTTDERAKHRHIYTDIALIKTDTPIRFNEMTQPACFSTTPIETLEQWKEADPNSYSNRNRASRIDLMLSGWGELDDDMKDAKYHHIGQVAAMRRCELGDVKKLLERMRDQSTVSTMWNRITSLKTFGVYCYATRHVFDAAVTMPGDAGSAAFAIRSSFKVPKSGQNEPKTNWPKGPKTKEATKETEFCRSHLIAIESGMFVEPTSFQWSIIKLLDLQRQLEWIQMVLGKEEQIRMYAEMGDNRRFQSNPELNLS